MRKVLIVVLTFVGALAAQTPATLKAGYAEVNITPPIGTPMAGYYSIRKAEGVHDDLQARALVLDDGGTRVAMVACDLVGVERAVIDAARARIAKQSGIPATAVMISATHSHTGPLMRSRFLEAADAESRRLADGYIEQLPIKIADAVHVAVSRLQPAAASGATGREDSLVFYRRFLMKDGTVRFNPGRLNPDIVKPAGTPDPDVQVVSFEPAAGGTPVATYVNYALHLDTVGGTRYSADYPFTVGSLLRKVQGSGAGFLFTIGAAGQINHIDASKPQPKPVYYAEARRIGTVLAGEVLKTLTRLQPASGALRASSEIVPLPLPSFTRDEVEAARRTAAQFGQPKQNFLEMVRAFKVLDVAGREGRPLDAEVQVIALGQDIAWVGVPGELFVELGRAIKEASPFRQTIIVELANGSISYIPDQKGFREGHYEAISARFAPGGGEKLVEAAVRLLKK